MTSAVPTPIQPRRDAVLAAIDAEQAVIGAVLAEPDALLRVQRILRVTDFYRLNHQVIYRAACAVSAAGAGSDMVTVHNYLVSHEQGGVAGGMGYLGDLVRHCVGSRNLEAHCQLILEKSRRRGILHVAGRLSERAYQPGADVTAAAHEAIEDLGAASAPVGSAGPAIVPFSAWAGRPVPPRESLVSGLVPMHETTLITGDGGLGKTLLCQQLATAVGCGGAVTEFMGFPIDNPGPVVALFCEDSEDEHHQRQDSINRWAGVSYTDLDVHALFRKGEENELAYFDSSGAMTRTPLWRTLHEAVGDYRARLLLVDPVAEVYPDNENDRAKVSRFVKRTLTAIAMEHSCAVLLVAHPSKSGLATGDGTSGSTAWSNAVRSRLYLHRPEEDGPTVLEHMKSNLSAKAKPIELTYGEGAFWLAQRRMDQRLRDREDEQALMRGLKVAVERGMNPSVARSGNWAVKLSQSCLGRGAPSTKRLEAALNALLDRGELVAQGHPKGPGYASLVVFPESLK